MILVDARFADPFAQPQDDVLVVEIESKMMDANRRQFVFYKNRKSDPTGVREAVRRAVLQVFESTQAPPEKRQIMDVLKASRLPRQKIRLAHADLTSRQFDKLLEGIRKQERWRWQKTPDINRGRPRKKGS